MLLIADARSFASDALTTNGRWMLAVDEEACIYNTGSLLRKFLEPAFTLAPIERKNQWAREDLGGYMAGGIRRAGRIGKSGILRCSWRESENQVSIKIGGREGEVNMAAERDQRPDQDGREGTT